MLAKGLATLLLSMAVLIGVMGTAAVANAETEQDIFASTLYPFMRTNCIKCHSEQATYPIGPMHTQKDVKMAFSIFSKFIDHGNFANSRFIKFASNKHFCKDYDTNCDRQDAIVRDLQNLFKDFTTQAKLLQNADTTTGYVIHGEQASFTQTLDAGGTPLLLKAELKKFSSDYYKVVSLSLTKTTQDAGEAYAFDGISIKVNGNFPQKLTGLEKFSRTLILEANPATAELIWHRSLILPVKDLDHVEIRLVNLHKVKMPESPLCAEFTNAQAVAYALLDDTTARDTFAQNTFGPAESLLNTLSAQQICEHVVLQINSQDPSQSTLLQQSAKANRGAILKFIKSVLTVGAKAPASERLKIESITANGRDTCYILSDQSATCFGSNTPGNVNLFSSDSKIIQAAAGLEDNGALTEDNTIIVGNNRYASFPNTENQRFNPNQKVVQFGIGDGISCYLTSDGEVYCGGYSLSPIDGAEDAYIKMKVPVAIKSIYVRQKSILMLSQKGDFYSLGGRDEYRFKIGSTLISSSNRKAVKHKLGYKVKQIIGSSDDICLRSEANEIRCYGNYAYAHFRENYQYGDLLKVDFDIEQVFQLGRSTCLLNPQKELYCVGSYPKGLISDAGTSSNQYMKITNLPANVVMVTSGFRHLCVVTAENLIHCAGDDGVIIGERESRNRVDDEGRTIFAGDQGKNKYLTPYIGAPIGRSN
jgi:hypothetical protein